jgi:hypothetical protein
MGWQAYGQRAELEGVPRCRAKSIQWESRRRVLVFMGELLEGPNLALREGKLLRFFV